MYYNILLTKAVRPKSQGSRMFKAPFIFMSTSRIFLSVFSDLRTLINNLILNFDPYYLPCNSQLLINYNEPKAI